MSIECRTVPKVKPAPAHLRSRGSQLWPGRCAYCGRDAPDTVDHVIPECLYARGYAPDEYLTVPSHRACNEGFSRAETAFKEDISAAGSNGAAAATRASVLRGFGRDHKRGHDMLARIREGRVYPLSNADTVRALRKVVRGLAFHRGLFLALPEDLVAVSSAQYEIPPAFLAEARFHEVRHPDIFECHCFVIGDLSGDEPVLRTEHSFWRLRFYDRVRFDAWVTAPRNVPTRA